MLHYLQKKLWIDLGTLAVVLLFIQLSIWQWHRYQWKTLLEQSYLSQQHALPQSISSVLTYITAHSQKTTYYKIFARGHYATKQFLLDNRIKHNQVGFDVITPLKLDQGGTILVDRGFVPANVHREINIDITPPTGSVQLTGLLTQPTKSFVLGTLIEPQSTLQWPMRVMRIDPSVLSEPLDAQLLPYVILLDAAQPDGYLREWTPPNLWAARSLGYCFQWAALALAVMIIYLKLR